MLLTLLEDDPYRLDLTRSLIGLRLKAGLPPLPDVQPQREQGPVPLEALLGAAENADDALTLYANLWQAIVQHPQSARGWAEFAKAFAIRFDWVNARLALDKAIASPTSSEPLSARAILAALGMMAEQSLLGDFPWEEWF